MFHHPSVVVLEKTEVVEEGCVAYYCLLLFLLGVMAAAVVALASFAAGAAELEGAGEFLGVAAAGGAEAEAAVVAGGFRAQ